MEIVAYHESGHAFMAAYLGGTVRSVTIDPDWDDGPRRTGDTQVVWRRGRFSQRELNERLVLVALAGPVAEMIYTGDPFHPAMVAEWAGDWKDAVEAARLFHPNPRQCIAWLEGVTVDLYRQLKSDPMWNALAALADELLAHETLGPEEIAEVLEIWLP